MCVLVTLSFPTLCNPMDCSLPGSSVHEILQARILEWVASSCLEGWTKKKKKRERERGSYEVVELESNTALTPEFSAAFYCFSRLSSNES